MKDSEHEEEIQKLLACAKVICSAFKNKGLHNTKFLERVDVTVKKHSFLGFKWESVKEKRITHGYIDHTMSDNGEYVMFWTSGAETHSSFSGPAYRFAYNEDGELQSIMTSAISMWFSWNRTTHYDNVEDLRKGLRKLEILYKFL